MAANVSDSRAACMAAVPMLHKSEGERSKARWSAGATNKEWRHGMLETIAVILIILWLLGLVSGYTMGNFIYVLLVIAIVLLLVRLISGRRVV
jgi:hypothetical protein